MRNQIGLRAVLGLISGGCLSNHVVPEDPGITAPRQNDASSDASTSVGSRRVLLISVDGLHGADLERFIGEHPESTLAGLAASGVRYRHVRAPLPSDSFPGVLALVTGGTPLSTGVYYDLSYDRTLSPPGSDCSSRGTRIDFSEAADLDSTVLDGGGGLDPTKLPRDPARGCALVFPHDYLRVNTVFEIAHAAGLHTAWCDKHLTYEILNGPSGKGIDDLWNPEIAANGVEKNIANTEKYDDTKVLAVLNQIRGETHDRQPSTVPALFGMNFQAVSVAQKLVTGGYADAAGTPSSVLAEGLSHTDQSIGRIVAELKTQGLWASTTLVVGASHGQSPIDRTLVTPLSSDLLPAFVDNIRPGLLAAATQDDVALLWLTDVTMAGQVAGAIETNGDNLGVDSALWGDNLLAQVPHGTSDPRVPDVIVRVKPGVMFLSGKVKIAEHGGFTDDDRNVALVVVAPGAQAAIVDDAVETRQVAPTILRALGLDPQELAAVRQEATPSLPALP